MISDRTRFLALIASAALNVFQIAGIAAVIYLGLDRKPKAPLPVLRHAAEALDATDHAALMALLRAQIGLRNARAGRRFVIPVRTRPPSGKNVGSNPG